MAVIKCPECNKDISSTVKKCSNCGYKIKIVKINSKYKKILVIVLIVILFVCSIIGFINSKSVRKEINDIGKVTINSENKISKAEKDYNKLNFFAKIFVFNYTKLKSARNKIGKIPVKLTTENIDDYIDINVTFSNFDYKLTSTFFLNQYRGTSDYKLIINPKKNFTFKNVKLTLVIEMYTWNYIYLYDVKLNKDGKYSESDIIECDSIATPPDTPKYWGKIEYKKVSGTIYNISPNK